MSKDKGFLKGLADQLNPMKAMFSMARPMIPAFQKQYQEMERPKEEGGILEGDEQKISLSMMDVGNGLELVAICYRMNTRNETVISRVIPLHNLNEL